MFKRLCVFCALLLLVGAFPASAAGDSWYCAHVENHERPRADASFSYIEQYDGYYISPDAQDKVIYLTFDAGYENGNVAKILDVLKEKEVPAAFFVLAHLIDRETALVSRMMDEGHLVCNHTTRHKDMSAMTDETVMEEELREVERVMKEKTGRKLSAYFRPPEGKFNETTLRLAQKMGYKTILWSFAYADWNNEKQMSCEKAKQKILSNVHPGEVMLLHPTSATNAAILGEVIDQCRAMGYRFGTLDELTAKRT